MCLPNINNEENIINAIIFWKYNENITFENLGNININELPYFYENYLLIPLNDFTNYYWDEQILSMPIGVFNEKKYRDNLRTLFLESNKDSIFFSIVIDNNIIMNGVNRTMPITAEKRHYDDDNYIKIIMKIKEDEVFFRFSNNYSTNSIWRNGIEDISIFFKEELYKYFFLQNKLVI